eukprot:CAMPEP_0194525016 /NCGR_PEP_ID=MMETSP0253-20130528/60340_1 /TAXON_ID=2966 /ORGANISM="Noctiluca scintillans" /LENGTH=85 /DNA_ID=CAMNT_0039369705 /DNA_START=132 /DNA_END=386 /DNA_ORIENTATION=-
MPGYKSLHSDENLMRMSLPCEVEEQVNCDPPWSVSFFLPTLAPKAGWLQVRREACREIQKKLSNIGCISKVDVTVRALDARYALI